MRAGSLGLMGSGRGQPIRKRLRRRETGGTRFITFSCERRLKLLGNPAIRDFFADSLAGARREHGFALFAWVVMPEHVHLLIRPRPGEPLGVALRSLKTGFAKAVIARWRRLNAPILDRLRVGHGGAVRFWQKGGGFDRNVRDKAEFCRKVKYIHRNPVEREFVERPEEWRWSSVRWWMGERVGEVECDAPPGDPRAWEQWRGYV